MNRRTIVKLGSLQSRLGPVQDRSTTRRALKRRAIGFAFARHFVLLVLGLGVVTALDSAGLFIYLGLYQIFTGLSLFLGLGAVAMIIVCVFRTREEDGHRSIRYCEIGLVTILVAVFFLLLPTLRTSRFKQFFILSRELRRCESVNDPLFRSVTARYTIDNYTDDPRTLWIRIDEPGDASNIIVHLADDRRTITQVEFDPD